MDPPARDNPFAQSFDVAHYFVGRHQQEAAAHLSYALAEGEGFTVITGERGVGKTSACRAFMSRLAPTQAAVAYLSGPRQSAGELLRDISRQLGIETSGESTRGLTDGLNEFLMQQRVTGRKVMVFIDDAQTLSAEVLEQVRLISNLETTRDKLIQIVLIGEPGLLEMLDSRELRQMGQRVSVCYELGPLTGEETAAYIRQRTALHGLGEVPEFSREAAGVIFRHTQGNPRRINQACAAALLLARRRNAGVVERALAAEATGELAKKPGGPRRRRLLIATALGLAAVLVAVAVARISTREAPGDRVAAIEPFTQPLPPVPEPPPATAPPEDASAVPPDATLHVPAPAPLPPAATQPPASPPLPAARRMTHSVQIGAFLVPENARQLVARLAAKGVSAAIADLRDAQGRIWHTVRVGDFPSRQAAQAHADEFARREQMKVLVRPFGSF
jgi:general secretion pathway protein A